ncbi:hypothetical protein [Nesterenkonia flava]|uniref:Uncharacterized protein n=1 Tax=Nesterenkonia flava TaxID=469799 RepID=A0ABU1FSC2_9MICC|nr:hypothetical protein [Nesterenkonia flava]MDR5711556.1 hypothetical protein [Nesterenkonia flava]
MTQQGRSSNQHDVDRHPEDTENQGQTEVTEGQDDPQESASAERAAADTPAMGSDKGPGDAEDFTIAIYSDPGRTSLHMRKLMEEQGQKWSRGATIKHKQLLIPLRQDATLDLDEVLKWAREDGADLSIILTEVPRTAGRRAKAVELHFREKMGVISFPALGPVALKASLRRELRRCVDALLYHSVDEAREKGGILTHVESQEGRETAFITPAGLFPGRVWMTLGMVAANEPFWSLTKLSGVFAAAAATGAFGIFFSTIWEMANFLPAWRLAIVSVIVISIVVLWLILANRLWDRPNAVGGRKEAVMYNASTVVTMVVSVTSLYLLLFGGILGMGLLLIEPAFMAQNIGEDEATFMNYVDVGWLSASMGVAAGAIGSNFDDDADLQRITQGSREAQRYPKDERQR